MSTLQNQEKVFVDISVKQTKNPVLFKGPDLENIKN